jgi:hypothetical protein
VNAFDTRLRSLVWSGGSSISRLRSIICRNSGESPPKGSRRWNVRDSLRRTEKRGSRSTAWMSA